MGAVRGDGAAGGGAGWVGGSPAAAAAEFSGDRGGRIWELKMKGAVGLGWVTRTTQARCILPRLVHW
jgi:hypothetical protein